jgi:putative membrane protein
MSVADLPAVNASLNSICTILLFAGWWFIKHERKAQHIACMVSALLVSAAFLTCYLVYHYHVGSVKFTAQGIVRPIYYFILITHVFLAAVILPLIVLTIVPALRARFDRHRKWAKITLPLWLYVSITGVIVYLMLYIWFPSAELAG